MLLSGRQYYARLIRVLAKCFLCVVDSKREDQFSNRMKNVYRLDPTVYCNSWEAS